MLNALVSELTGVLVVLERINAIEHFTLSIIETHFSIPTAVVQELSPLLNAVEECHVGLKKILSDKPLRQIMLPHYGQSDAFNSHAILQQRLEQRQDWRCGPSISNTNDYNPKLSDESIPSNVVNLGHINYSNAPSPECLEALNLSVAASPECLAAINLSLAPSPCYNPSEEVNSAKDSLKTLNDGATTFWDNVTLDVVNTFDGGNIPGPISTHPLENSSLEFVQDIDSTSVLGDGYMLDISSNVNISVTDALNASIYFGLHRDPPEIISSNIVPETETLETNIPIPSAALDLSHQPLENPSHFETTVMPYEKKSFICQICGKKLNTKSSLRRHCEAHGEGSKICDFCGKAFHSSWLLRRHVLAHISNHVCKTCGKRCVDEGKLKRHIATHSFGAYSCNICRKRFCRPDGLKRHTDIMHLNQKEFVCYLCNHSFSVKCNLDSHMDSVHGGSCVVCDSCGKKCKNKGSLRVHSRIHKQPVQTCHICKQSFHRSFHYKRHMKNRHGDL